MDTQTSLLQSINTTTNSILEAVQSGSSEETVPFELWDLSYSTGAFWASSRLFVRVYPTKKVMEVFGHWKAESYDVDKVIVPAGVFYFTTDDATTSTVYLTYGTPEVSIRIPHTASDAVVFHNSDGDDGFYHFYSVFAGWTSYTIDSTSAIRLV